MRILRGQPGVLRAAFVLADEEGVAVPDDKVYVTIVDANGDVVVAADEATVNEDHTFSYRLPPQSELAKFTVTWTGRVAGEDWVTTTHAEIVGGFIFSLADLRKDPALSNVDRFPTWRLADAREAVEEEFELICHRSFTPRYAREVWSGDGTNTLRLRRNDPLAAISLMVNGEDWLPRVSSGMVRLDGRYLVVRGVWPCGEDNIVIEYEYGLPAVPKRVRDVALKRARNFIKAPDSRIDERATMMQIDGFGTFHLATPGKSGYRTGVPEIDAVLDDWTEHEDYGVY